MSKEIVPMLVRVDIDLVKKPFNPDVDYFAARKGEKKSPDIEKKINDRFPGVPSMPDKSKLLSVYYMIETAIKGDLLLSHLRLVDKKFLEYARDKSLDYDIARRTARRKEFVKAGYEKFWQEEELKVDRRYKFYFEKSANTADLNRKMFQITNTKAYLDRAPAKRRQEIEADEDLKQQTKWTKEAIRRSLEKVPKEMILTGNSLSKILSEIGETNTSTVMAAYSAVQESIMNIYADQINDHVKKAAPNAILFSASALLTSAPLTSATSSQPILQALNNKQAATVNSYIHHAKKNLDFAMADQLNDHMAPNPKGVIQSKATTVDQRIASFERDKEHATDVNVQRGAETTKLIQKHQGNMKQHISALVTRAFDNHKKYWVDFDQQNEKIVRPISASTMSSSPLAESVTDSPDLSGENSLLLEKVDKHKIDSGDLAYTLKGVEFQRESQMRLSTKDHDEQIGNKKLWREVEAMHHQWLHKSSLKSTVGREMQWSEFDKTHQWTPRSATVNSTSPDSLLKELPFHSPAHVFASLQSSSNKMNAGTDEQARFLYHQINTQTQSGPTFEYKDSEQRVPEVPKMAESKDISSDEQGESIKDKMLERKESSTKKAS